MKISLSIFKSVNTQLLSTSEKWRNRENKWSITVRFITKYETHWLNCTYIFPLVQNIEGAWRRDDNIGYCLVLVFLLPYKSITQLINYNIASITFPVHHFVFTIRSSFLRGKYIHVPILSANLVELGIPQFKENNWEIIP
jgi:hypothetical protein